MFDVKIAPERDNLFTAFGLKTLQDQFLINNETPQEALARASMAFADDEEHAQRLYNYASRHWFMFSTPILANGGTDRGLGISCNLLYVHDSMRGITEHLTEAAMLTSNGAGLSGYWGHIRTGQKTSKGKAASGVVPFLKATEAVVAATAQGGTRRGGYAAYMDISHPEILDFLDIRDKTGDIHRRCLTVNFHHAVNITDAFMEAVKTNSDWNLIDPHNEEIVNTVKARDLWIKLLQVRRKSGEPYIHFIDTSNRYLPNFLKEQGWKVLSSNLCNEVMLPTYNEKTKESVTAICCLSSVNADKYDEWKNDYLFIEDIIRMLDNVVEDYLEKLGFVWGDNAYQGAINTRDLGLGLMGFHSLLQQRGIAFESHAASELNTEIFSFLKSAAEKASSLLLEQKGPAHLYLGLQQSERRRNAHLLAIAPNATSSIVCGNVSPSIEPYPSNAYRHTTQSGNFFVKNKYLEKLLTELGKNTDEVWSSIVANEGSVQQLQFLTDEQKLVFKTAREIDQMWVVEHAAARQPWICQGQSVNLFFDENTTNKQIHDVHMSAWLKGLKGLYYFRSSSISKGDKVGVVISRETVDPEMVTCLACEG